MPLKYKQGAATNQLGIYLNSKKNNLYFIVSDTEQLNALAN